MGYTIIAPLGDNIKALFIGIKEFPTERVILLTPRDALSRARSIGKKLEEFTIPVEIMHLTENVMESMFESFGKICSVYDNDDIIVNVATGDRITTCAALSAAYANGLKAIGTMGNRTMMMPIMKLSYCNQISGNKMAILKELDGKGWVPLNEISGNLSMSVSLLSYHINGNFKYKGLKELRLVEVKEQNKNLFVKLSDLGRLLLKGYIPPKQECVPSAR